jgi:hypothetical protein
MNPCRNPGSGISQQTEVPQGLLHIHSPVAKNKANATADLLDPR